MTKINTSVSLNTEFAGRVYPYYKAPGENKDRVVKSSAALSEPVLPESKIRKTM